MLNWPSTMAPRGAPRLAAATLVVAVLVIASQASAHPTFYPEVARRLATGNMSCVDPGPAPVLSYHIHMLYSQNNAKDTSDALAAKAAFAAHFGLDKVPPCHGLFHQGRACMEIGDTVPAGPFPIAQWSAFILPQNFSTSECAFARHQRTCLQWRCRVSSIARRQPPALVWLLVAPMGVVMCH